MNVNAQYLDFGKVIHVLMKKVTFFMLFKMRTFPLPKTTLTRDFNMVNHHNSRVFSTYNKFLLFYQLMFRFSIYFIIYQISYLYIYREYILLPLVGD